MSAAIMVLLLAVAVAQGNDCRGPITANKEFIECHHMGLTNIPVLPAEAVVV